MINIQTQKGYLVKMSVGFEIQADEDELAGLIEAIKKGGMIKLKRGIIKADFVAGIIEDKERVMSVERISDGGTRTSETKLLADIFKGTNFNQKLLS